MSAREQIAWFVAGLYGIGVYLVLCLTTRDGDWRTLIAAPICFLPAIYLSWRT